MSGMSGLEAQHALALRDDRPPSPPPRRPPSTLTVENRDVFTFRATVVGVGPTERVRAAEQRLAALPADALGDPVTFRPCPWATRARWRCWSGTASPSA
jgi:hypothetical protein